MTFSRLITSVGEDRTVYSAIIYLYFLFEGVSSSLGCLGKAALFNCSTQYKVQPTHTSQFTLYSEALAKFGNFIDNRKET